MPTGGITAKNAGDYLKYEKILCCGGTWMVSPALIRDGKFEEIERLTAEAKKQQSQPAAKSASSS